MNRDIIILYDDNEKKEYKLLMVINKEYKYLIYTEIDNFNPEKKLYAIKTKALKSGEETIPITDEEWTMIEKVYTNLINT